MRSPLPEPTLGLSDAHRVLWDAVIVGTGIGGATLGLALAQAGKRVVFVEKGRDLLADDSVAIRGRTVEADPTYKSATRSVRNELLSRAGRSADEFLDGVTNRSFLPELGCGTGGSSALYGMVMERFFPSDFEPRAHHRDAAESTLPERWPVSYEELRPWYERAERLYRVRGGPDPLRQDGADSLTQPAELSPGVQSLFNDLASRRLHPYRLHTACEALDNCTSCQGYLCPRLCKNDSDRMALRPAVAHGAVLLSDCEALYIEANRNRVVSVVCRRAGASISLRGQMVVVAAGAVGTPAVLLQSHSPHWPFGLANGSGMVGRNLMRHGIDLWALLGTPPIENPKDAKGIGFNDLYNRPGSKLGTVQSFGLLPPLTSFFNQRSPFWQLAMPIASPVWSRFQRTPILATILEDLPYAENRIEVEPGDGARRVRVSYRPGPSERRRRQEFRSELRPFLRGLGAVRISSADPPKALGHVCGTCRFGDDPRSSVLDSNSRAHELENLYVVDASIFPSSAGINPALTIAAHALRVGAHLISRL